MVASTCPLTTQQLVLKTDPDTIAAMTQAYEELRQHHEKHQKEQRQAAQRWWRRRLIVFPRS